MFYRAATLEERYSAQDTIRAQGNIYLTTGTQLLSNEGNAHADHRRRYVRTARHARRRLFGGEQHGALRAREAAHAQLPRQLSAGARTLGGEVRHRDFSKRDLASNINFFMNVPVTPEGKLTFADGVSAPGRYVEMRAEMDVTVLISNCPQLNNPCNAYNPTPVEVLVWDR